MSPEAWALPTSKAYSLNTWGKKHQQYQAAPAQRVFALIPPNAWFQTFGLPKSVGASWNHFLESRHRSDDGGRGKLVRL